LRRRVRRSARAIACGLLCAAALLPACGLRSAAGPAVVAPAAEPRWQDAFDPVPELVLVIRPHRLQRDPVYGPLLRRALELARERRALATATRALDAIEDAEEVIVGLRGGLGPARDGSGGSDGSDGGDGTGGSGGIDAPDASPSDDMLLVLRGVRADLDPATLVDERGQPLWTAGPPGAVRELCLAREATEAGGRATPVSLFELPARTWVVALGAARARARAALAPHLRPVGPRPPRGAAPATSGLAELEPEAVAFARVSGPSLVARVRALRSPGLLSPLGQALETATLALSAGEDALVRATLTYRDGGALDGAEATVRRALAALTGVKPEEYSWLRPATVERKGHGIVIAAPLPEKLVSGLLGGPRQTAQPAPAPGAGALTSTQARAPQTSTDVTTR